MKRVISAMLIFITVIGLMPAALAEAKPVIEYLPGWGCDVSKVRCFGDLPAAAQEYVRFVENAIGTPITYVSVGADRDAIILR